MDQPTYGGTPSSYNNGPPTYTQPTPNAMTMKQDFMKSLTGILIAIQCVLSFSMFVSAASDHWFAAWSGGGFCIFVGVVTWLISMTWYAFHLFNLSQSLGANFPLDVGELIYTGVATILFFISACIASSKWSWGPGVRACAMFSWFGVFALGADTARRVMAHRQEHTPSLSTHTTTTTSTAATSGGITTESHY